MKRMILFSLMAAMLATTTGCGLFQAVFCYRPCAMRGDCSMGGECDDGGCGTRCGPVRGGCGMHRARVYGDCGDDGCPDCGRPCRLRCRSCGSCGSCGTCGDCGDACSDPCGDSCYGRPWHRGPLSCLFALFTPCSWCGRGCGERYWGDFYSDPPDCWDPCDCSGNYTGGGSMSGGPVSGGGCRHCGGGGGGYSSCQGGHMSDGMTSDENVVSDRVVSPAGPRQSGEPHRATKPN
ncbi:MAG: hypothetical protein ABFC96_08620 [Thermoguttaceae bacterium]